MMTFGQREGECNMNLVFDGVEQQVTFLCDRCGGPLIVEYHEYDRIIEVQPCQKCKKAQYQLGYHDKTEGNPPRM